VPPATPCSMACEITSCMMVRLALPRASSCRRECSAAARRSRAARAGRPGRRSCAGRCPPGPGSRSRPAARGGRWKGRAAQETACPGSGSASARRRGGTRTALVVALTGTTLPASIPQSALGSDRGRSRYSTRMVAAAPELSSLTG
jgi:hypothetical protein